METINMNPQEVVDSVEHIISLPEIYLRLEETIKNPHHTIREMCSVISLDPALSMRVLKIVNSALFNLPVPVKDVSVAINLIGELELRNMVLVLSIVNTTTSADCDLDVYEFWKNSISCAIASKTLARRRSSQDQNTMFLCGLLHDIGVLVLDLKKNSLSHKIDHITLQHDQDRHLVENNILGFNHATIGALLAKLWKLPIKISHIIQYHHDVENAKQYTFEVKIIALSNQFVSVLNDFNDIENVRLGEMSTLMQSYLIDMGIDQSEFQLLLHQIQEQTQVVHSMILTA